MHENFNTYYDNIDHSFWRNLCVEEGAICQFSKGEEFISAGEVARYIGYIKSGALKYVAYSADGTEHVVGLEFAGGFVADFPFSLLGEKSRISIVAVTNCEIFCIPTKDVETRLETDESLRDIVAATNVALFDTLYDRYISLHTKNAQKRYDELITKHSDLFAIFPLKDIASFLNITPTHLSRLRKSD